MLTLCSAAHGAGIDGLLLENPSDDPVPLALVRVIQVSPREVIADLETDRYGRFRISDIPPGAYRLEFKEPNHLPASMPIELTRDGQPVLMRIIRYGVISGIARDAAQAPASGSIIALVAPKDVATAMQDLADKRLKNAGFGNPHPDGSFRIHSLPAGRYILGQTCACPNGTELIMDGGAPRVFELSAGEEMDRVNITVSPRNSTNIAERIPVHGDIVNGEGYDFQVLYRSLVDLHGVPMGMMGNTTNQKDRFNFPAAQRGTSDIILYGQLRATPGEDAGGKPSHVYGRTEFIITERDTPPIELPAVTVGPGASVPFRLQAAPACTAPFNVKLDGSMMLVNLSDTLQLSPESPTAEATNLGPLRYRITATTSSPDDCWITAPDVLDMVTPPAEPIVILHEPLGSIQGRVDLAGQDPQAFQVTMLASGLPAQASSSAASGGTRTMTTPLDPEGRFSFTQLKPGEYRIGIDRIAPSQRLAGLDEMFRFEVSTGAALEIEIPAPSPEANATQ